MLDHSELTRYLAKIDQTFGIDQLLNIHPDKDSIIRYYTDSEKGYRLFHNSDGAVHMTLISPDQPSSQDTLGQARIVQKHINELSARNVIELGCGKGFNLGYLARLNPESSLFGVDLTPKHLSIAKKKYAGLQNLTFVLEDFQSLSFDDKQFDLAFEVEALCHAHDASKAFGEVYRVLRPGGRFVIFDGFRDDDLSKYSDEIKTAVRLVELTMSVETFSALTEWLTIAKSVGFKVLSTTDLSNAILPNLEKFQFLARGFYKFPKLNNLLGRVMSPALLKNSVAGLLMPFTVSSGAQKYNLVILEKPSTK